MVFRREWACRVVMALPQSPCLDVRLRSTMCQMPLLSSTTGLGSSIMLPVYCIVLGVNNEIWVGVMVLELSWMKEM